eukprot:scaffold18.g1898.t1
MPICSPLGGCFAAQRHAGPRSGARRTRPVRAAAAGAVAAPGRWLGPAPAPLPLPDEQPSSSSSRPRYGVELTAEEWDPLGLSVMKAETSRRGGLPGFGAGSEEGGGFGEFLQGDLPKKLALLLGLIVFSRVGVYIRLPGVDVGVFSLGIVPYINASILLQLLATAFPSLKKLQREEGPQARRRGRAGAGAGARAPCGRRGAARRGAAGGLETSKVADTLTELKLGNGTSVLIFANIASALPSSAAGRDSANLAVYAASLFATTLGIVYVQDAERQIPMTYASRYRAGALQARARGGGGRQAYLPFKVNATGVMPVIFASSLLALPSAVARYANVPALESAAAALSPSGPLYLPANVGLIVAFNYLYTFLQLDPKDLSEQLKRQGASVPGIRPGRATAEYITRTLDRMSVLGSAFLGALAAAPALVEALTGLQAFRGFAASPPTDQPPSRPPAQPTSALYSSSWRSPLSK